MSSSVQSSSTDSLTCHVVATALRGQVTLRSGQIQETENPRKAKPESVYAHVVIKPSIKQRDSYAMLCIKLDEFHFGSYDFTNADQERVSYT